MRGSQILIVVASLFTLAGMKCSPSQPSTVSTTTNGTKSGAELHVYFQGMIAHNVQTAPLRALLIDTSSEDLPHETLMTIPGVKDSNRLNTEIGTGPKQWTECSSGCTVNIAGLGIEFVDGSGNHILPKFSTAFPTGSNSQKIVPSLRDAVVKTSTDTTFGLTKDATSDYPPTGKKIAAWVELDGGVLSVWDTFACKAHFKDIEDDTKLRPWAKTLRLTANSQNTIKMRINKGTGWQDPIEFAADSTVHIDVFISNAPRRPNGESHFHMYHILSEPPVTLHEVMEDNQCSKKGDRDIVAGCSNSTWP